MKKRGAPHDFAKSSPNRVRSSSSSEHDNTTVQDSFESFLDSESQLETQDTSLLTFARPLSPFADLLQHGYVALADAVFNYESKRNHPKTSDGLAHWRRVCVPILAALPNGVLRGIVYGDLAETYRQGDPDLVELYGSEHPSSESYETTSIETTTWLHNASMVAPGHYVRYFVAPSTGLPPTIGELNVIVETLQTYLAQVPQPSYV
ncbi:hypothetical protein J4E89_006166 [Alternaria sp. Ai002NY15]|nr:hypothetical protein J4E89_006166 [Alternaria sp. Ai002NY15]